MQRRCREKGHGACICARDALKVLSITQHRTRFRKRHQLIALRGRHALLGVELADTTSSTGVLILTVMAGVAAFERARSHQGAPARGHRGRQEGGASSASIRPRSASW
jgi:DNA invertase Pin-like site-specific DNA recombinase